ncbi:MAG: DUF1566 domain-containing protein [Candidatus Marinimicrobia bacterium]|nr:DUF1566 domain-containing protein [Candidatus Neomarinimicrobiota bacterium]
MKKKTTISFVLTNLIFLLIINTDIRAQSNVDYPIIDTGQELCYDTVDVIVCPQFGESFYGQDAQYTGNPFAYQNNGDGTVTDTVTGLMWQQTPDLYDKSNYAEALAAADTFSLAGYDDWRLPSIKELYSLIDFNGSSFTLVPYIDTSYFDFRFGDENLGERVIDGQYWSSTEYVGTTMNNDPTTFGVNFADGRIKGYPSEPVGPPEDQFNMTAFVRYVRGNTNYGINDFVDNSDGTISDVATGLMWQASDNGDTHNWVEALEYAENLSYAGFDDWRLPNAKELQSIVDYTRAPDAINTAQQGPAIDPIFGVTETESWYWTSTTLLESPPNLGVGGHAIYVTFGQAYGWMEFPPNSGEYAYTNVHGAGAQRSDPKVGNPTDWPNGFGPQGDDVRIYNYVRAVRDVDASTSVGDDYGLNIPSKYILNQNYPNPFNPVTTIQYNLPHRSNVQIIIFDLLGSEVKTIVSEVQNAGFKSVLWDATNVSSGMYFYQIRAGDFIQTKKMVLLK